MILNNIDGHTVLAVFGNYKQIYISANYTSFAIVQTKSLKMTNRLAKNARNEEPFRLYAAKETAYSHTRRV